MYFFFPSPVSSMNFCILCGSLKGQYCPHLTVAVLRTSHIQPVSVSDPEFSTRLLGRYLASPPSSQWQCCELSLLLLWYYCPFNIRRFLIGRRLQLTKREPKRAKRYDRKISLSVSTGRWGSSVLHQRFASKTDGCAAVTPAWCPVPSMNMDLVILVMPCP